jgi:Asp-tRNA(Asn)/Glu-tRNA(Gln) amidotransferase A subunit family amidase
MAPLALGSQTTGSTIRPASYCGVYGFKPTHGLIPRHGMLQLSRTLDHVGLFARAIQDVALLLETLAAYDDRDGDSRPRARVPYRDVAAAEPPLPPMFGFMKTSLWDRVDADAREAFGELVASLGDRVEEIELAVPTDEVLELQRAIGGAEIAINLRREWDKGREKLSPALQARIEHGRQVRAVDYLGALSQIPLLNDTLTELFEQRYDAILTPAASGTAPAGLESTGDPAFCALWTLCGVPALSVPLMQGANDLPLGVQLVGARHRDGQLLRTARWLVDHVVR